MILLGAVVATAVGGGMLFAPGKRKEIPSAARQDIQERPGGISGPTKTRKLVEDFTKKSRAGVFRFDNSGAVDLFFQSAWGREDMPDGELVDIVLGDFPLELRGRYINLIFQDLCRKDPLGASVYLDKIPPGEILSKCIGQIGYGAAVKNVSFELFQGWLNKISYPEDRQLAYSTFFSGKDWKGSSFDQMEDILAKLPSDSLRKELVYNWLSEARDKGSMDVARVLSYINRASLKNEMEANINLQLGPTTKSAPALPAGETAVNGDSGSTFKNKGVESFSPKLADYGYTNLLSKLGNDVSERDRNQAVSGWYWTFSHKDPLAAARIFSEHPELQKEEFSAITANTLLQVDRESLKIWMTTNSSASGVVKYGIDSWLTADSTAASEWVGSLPEGNLKNSAVFHLVEWLNKKGDLEAAKAWEEFRLNVAE